MYKKPFNKRPQAGTPLKRPEPKTIEDYRAEKKEKTAQLEDWIWGEHSVDACVDSNPENLLEIFIEHSVSKKVPKLIAKLEGLNLSLVEKLPRMFTEKRTQGIAAKIKKFPVFNEDVFFEKDVNDKNITQVLVLDRIQDPQNFGAILRSAAALGATSIIIGRREQCPVNGTVALVSAGNLFKVKIYTANNLSRSCEKLKESGFQVYALEMGGQNMSTWIGHVKPEKIAWILGSEEDGIGHALLKAADEKVGIPMISGVESLNVSNSAAIALYEGMRVLKSNPK